MKKTLLLSIALTSLLTSNCFAETKSEVIYQEISKSDTGKGRNIIEHFITPTGVECIRVNDTGYSKNGSGLSCNWEAYNKKNEEKSKN